MEAILAAKASDKVAGAAAGQRVAEAAVKRPNAVADRSSIAQTESSERRKAERGCRSCGFLLDDNRTKTTKSRDSSTDITYHKAQTQQCLAPSNRESQSNCEASRIMLSTQVEKLADIYFMACYDRALQLQ